MTMPKCLSHVIYKNRKYDEDGGWRGDQKYWIFLPSVNRRFVYTVNGILSVYYDFLARAVVL